MDIFYIMFDCVVVGIIASEASEKKTNKNPRESRGGSVVRFVTALRPSLTASSPNLTFALFSLNKITYASVSGNFIIY